MACVPIDDAPIQAYNRRVAECIETATSVGLSQMMKGNIQKEDEHNEESEFLHNWYLATYQSNAVKSHKAPLMVYGQ